MAVGHKPFSYLATGVYGVGGVSNNFSETTKEMESSKCVDTPGNSIGNDYITIGIFTSATKDHHWHDLWFEMNGYVAFFSVHQDDA